MVQWESCHDPTTRKASLLMATHPFSRLRALLVLFIFTVSVIALLPHGGAAQANHHLATSPTEVVDVATPIPTAVATAEPMTILSTTGTGSNSRGDVLLVSVFSLTTVSGLVGLAFLDQREPEA